MKQKIWIPALIFLVHLGLGLIATYPGIESAGESLIGGSDAAQNAWNLWWVNTACGQGNYFPFYTDQIYWPTGVSLAYHPLGLLNGWIGYLLQSGLGLNLALTYNTITILSFALTGLFTYYLAKYLVKDDMAAFVASIIFTFAPIRVSRVLYGNLEMYSTEFIPLAVLFLVKTLKEGKYYYAILSGLAFAATVWMSLYLAVGLLLFFSLYFVIDIFSDKKSFGQKLFLFGLCGLVTLLLSMPVILPMVRDYPLFKDQANQISTAASNSADLLGFIIPDRSLSLLVKRIPGINEQVTQIYSSFYGNPYEKTVFLGYSVIALTLSSLIWVTRREKHIWVWIITSSIFIVLCLGPTLHIGGKEVLPHLPYEWIGQIPLIGFGRVPSRLGIILMMPLSLTCAYAIQALHARFRSISKFPGLFFSALVFIEFLSLPMVQHKLIGVIPDSYYAADLWKYDGAILDVPIDLYGAQGPGGTYMLYQTVHKHPIISGYISRTPTSAIWVFEYPFLNELRARIYSDQDTAYFPNDLLISARSELEMLQATYIVLHNQKIREEDLSNTRDALNIILGDPVFEDKWIVVWVMK